MSSNDEARVGDLVRAARESLDLSLRATAAKRGVSPSVQSHLEQADDVRLSTLRSFTDAVGGSLIVSFTHPTLAEAAAAEWGPRVPNLHLELATDPDGFIHRASAAIGRHSAELRAGAAAALATTVPTFLTEIAFVDEDPLAQEVDEAISPLRREQQRQALWRDVMASCGVAFTHMPLNDPELILTFIDTFHVTPGSDPPVINGDIQQRLADGDEQTLHQILAVARWARLQALTAHVPYLEAGMPDFDEALEWIQRIADDDTAMAQFWVDVGHDLTALTGETP